MPDSDRPLHCLQYLDELRLEKGGVVRSVLDLTAVLAEAGVRVTLITGDDQDAPAEWRGDGADGTPRVFRINRPLTRLTQTASDRSELAAYVADADVVHLHQPWDPFNPTVATAARRAGKPYVVTIHGMLDDWCLKARGLKKKVYLELFGRRFLERSSRLHYTATIEREQSQPRAPRGKPIVLPLIVDLAPFRDLPGPALAGETFPDAFAGGGARLLFVGRLHPIKGLDLLIEAFAAAEHHGPAPHLLLAGPSEPWHERWLRSQAEGLGVADRVHFLGMVHGDVKHSLYQSCDAFVLPSHHENFGIALAEAMICGAPALLTKSVNIWPEIQDLGGVVVDRSAAGLKEGIERVLKEREWLRQTGLSNRPAMLEWLDPQRLAGEYVQMYQEAIAAPTNS